VAYPKRFLLLGMLLFKDILPILAFNHQDSESCPIVNTATHQAVFTPNFVLSALHLLVDKLLPLTSTDLEALEDEPEEWLIREGADEDAWAYEFRVRSRSLLCQSCLLVAVC
jgi:hypothetical protein